jgi:hypothetical protein
MATILAIVFLMKKRVASERDNARIYQRFDDSSVVADRDARVWYKDKDGHLFYFYGVAGIGMVRIRTNFGSFPGHGHF